MTVATSDGLEQVIIRGQGCVLLSARELREEIIRVSEETGRAYADRQDKGRNYLMDSVAEEIKEELNKIGKG